MLIELPDDMPIMLLLEFAANNGYQVRWEPDGEVKAKLIPIEQSQSAGEEVGQ